MMPKIIAGCSKQASYPALYTSFAVILASLFISLQSNAQEKPGDDDVYVVAVKIAGGGPAVRGYLYAVNDTSIVLLPSRTQTKRAVKGALANTPPVSVPMHLVKKVTIMKVRTIAHMASVGFLLGFGYSIVYVSAFGLNSPAAIIPYAVSVTLLSVLTMNLIYTRNYRPTEPAFVMKMQKFCLKKDELMVDR